MHKRYTKFSQPMGCVHTDLSLPDVNSLQPISLNRCLSQCPPSSSHRARMPRPSHRVPRALQPRSEVCPATGRGCQKQRKSWDGSMVRTRPDLSRSLTRLCLSSDTATGGGGAKGDQPSRRGSSRFYADRFGSLSSLCGAVTSCGHIHVLCKAHSPRVDELLSHPCVQVTVCR